VPFRPRSPSKTELEVYKSMTRLWHPEMKQRIFPEHFRIVGEDVADEPQRAETQIK
jgi:hypothetical protein